MKLKGFEPFQAVESPPVDYEAELAKFVDERASTAAVDTEVTEQPTEDATDAEVKHGMARLLDYIAEKQKRKKQGDPGFYGNTNVSSIRQKVSDAYYSLDEIEDRIILKGLNIDHEV